MIKAYLYLDDMRFLKVAENLVTSQLAISKIKMEDLDFGLMFLSGMDLIIYVMLLRFNCTRITDPYIF